MLSPLQQKVARLLQGLPEAEDFVLAGGAALIVHGDVDRLTRDLDFFTVEPNAVDSLLPAFEAAARKAGLALIEEQVAHGFARLVVSDGTDQTGVDLASDARLFAPEPSELGLILSAEELAVDKVLAVFGRAEARDFVDLAALEPRFGLAHLCELAERKDTGFRRPVLAEMLDRFDRLDRDEFDVDDTTFASIVVLVRQWRTRLRAMPG